MVHNKSVAIVQTYKFISDFIMADNESKSERSPSISLKTVGKLGTH